MHHPPARLPRYCPGSHSSGGGRGSLLLGCLLALTEAVLEATAQVAHVAHAPGAGGAPTDFLLAPLEHALLGAGVAARRAGGLLDVEADLVAASAGGVGLCVCLCAKGCVLQRQQSRGACKHVRGFVWMMLGDDVR